MADGGGSQNPLSVILPGLDQQVSGRQQQSGAEKQQESLSHGGVDPKYISEFEPFDGFSHEDIYNAVQQMQPGVMQQFGDQWVAMFTEISGAVTGLMIQTARASSSLHGEFASAGEAAGRKFVTEATDVYTVLSAVGHRVKAAAYGAEAVKVAVPAPINATVVTDPGTSVPATLAELAVPGSAATTEREKEDRRLQAIAAMKTTYMPTYGPAGENVPTFVAPTQPGTGNPLDPGSGGGGSNNGGATTGGSGTTTDDGTTTGEDPGTTEETTQPGTTDDETTTAGTDTEDSGGSDDSQGDDSTTDPASTTPASTTPASTTPGTTPGTSPGGGGSPGSGSPGGSSPGGAALTPGGSVAGRAPAGVGQNLAAAGISGAAGAASAGRGMSPGMMGAPGARGGGKDDEQEHSAPDYLRRVQPELFGDDIPAVPEAIGSDAPSTRVADQDQGGAGAS